MLIEREKLSRRDGWVLALLLGLTTLLYSGSFPKEFTNWDDQKYITDNPLIQILSLKNLNRIVTEPYFCNYAPVTLLSYALDYRIWKLNANGYHLTTVLLHIACVLALYFLLVQLKLSRGIVILSVTLFAIHPVNVESVSWASERKNLLAALFFFLSFQHYIRFKQDNSRTHYLSSLLFFLLSILSKASTLVAPLVYLAYDYCFEGKKFRTLELYEKLPFLAAGEALTFFTIHAAGAGSSLHSYHGGGPWLSALGIGRLFWDYLKLLFFPVKLIALYRSGPPPYWTNLGLWVSLALMVALIYAVGRISRMLLFCPLYFVILLLPVLNIVPLPVRMADRYLYIPQVGIWVIFTAFVTFTYQQLAKFRLARSALVIGLSLLGVYLAQLTYVGSRAWRNSHTLWSDVIAKDYKVRPAHCNLGFWYMTHKQLNRAGLEFLITCRLDPTYYLAVNAMGGYYLEKGKLDQAETYFKTASRLAPDYDHPIENLGKVLAEKGNLLRAVYMFHRASYLNPNNLDVLNCLVVVYLKTGQLEAAQDTAQLILKKDPTKPDGFLRLGQVLEARGDLRGAFDTWQKGHSKIDPANSALAEFDQKLIVLRRRLEERESKH